MFPSNRIFVQALLSNRIQGHALLNSVQVHALLSGNCFQVHALCCLPILSKSMCCFLFQDFDAGGR